MTIIIFGIIVLLIGFFGTKIDSPLHKYKTLVIIAGIIITGAGLVTSAVRIINPGHVGVKILFGKVESGFLPEGMNFVNPLIDVEEMRIRTQNYTMSATAAEGQIEGDDAVRVLSKDGLEVVIDLTVLYRVNPAKAASLFQNVGLNYEAIVIRPLARTRIRESAAQYEAVDLYSNKRKEFEAALTDSISKDFSDYGLILESIRVRNINLPASVKESIERKNTAYQEAQRMKYVLEKERSEAERKRVEAKGKADAQKIVDSTLTNRILQFEMIQVQKELVSSPNAKVIVLGEGKSAPPFIIGK